MYFIHLCQHSVAQLSKRKEWKRGKEERGEGEGDEKRGESLSFSSDIRNVMLHSGPTDLPDTDPLSTAHTTYPPHAHNLSTAHTTYPPHTQNTNCATSHFVEPVFLCSGV